MPATLARTPTRTPSIADPADRGRAWLASLFAGEFPFTVVPTAALPPRDRSAAEYDAISRAAGCRDLFIVHADAAAGERAITDLARATTDRVLILSPDPAAADRLTERLLKHAVPVLRALADDENPVRPSPAVSKATSRALTAAQGEQARRAVTAAEQRVEKFAVVAKAVARLAEVNDLLKKLDADVAERTAQRDRVEAELAAEGASPTPTAFGERIASLRTEYDTALAGLTERRTAARAAVDSKEAELNALRQQLAGTTRSGFFSWLFGRPKSTFDVEDVKKRLHTTETELAALTAAAATLQAETDARRAAFEAECQKRKADELATQRAAGDAALAAAEAERARARTEVAALNAVIGAAVPGDDPAAAERELSAARERAAEVAKSEPDALAGAVARVRVVTGTPGCLDSDPVFSAFTADPPFGLLVLDRAEELPESEFPRLARLAERWVLVGDAAPRDEPRLLNGAARPSRNGRLIEVSFVARLAKLLDRETWAAEGDRLVCRLVHLTPDQRRHGTREPLADRPEIELRFAASDAEPVLAEIAFPGSTAVPAAKSFLFHTLNEVLLRPCGECVWTHAADAITATWSAADTARDATWIDLEPGVREKITGAGLFAYTAAVRFDPAAGWDAEKAAEWLGKYLPPPATGRFAAVPRSTGVR